MFEIGLNLWRTCFPEFIISAAEKVIWRFCSPLYDSSASLLNTCFISAGICCRLSIPGVLLSRGFSCLYSVNSTKRAYTSVIVLRSVMESELYKCNE